MKGLGLETQEKTFISNAIFFFNLVTQIIQVTCGFCIISYLKELDSDLRFGCIHFV
jgi:hypothetical protein